MKKTWASLTNYSQIVRMWCEWNPVKLMLNVNDTHVFVLENYLTAAKQTGKGKMRVNKWMTEMSERKSQESSSSSSSSRRWNLFKKDEKNVKVETEVKQINNWNSQQAYTRHVNLFMLINHNN